MKTDTLVTVWVFSWLVRALFHLEYKWTFCFGFNQIRTKRGRYLLRVYPGVVYDVRYDLRRLSFCSRGDTKRLHERELKNLKYLFQPDRVTFVYALTVFWRKGFLKDCQGVWWTFRETLLPCLKRWDLSYPKTHWILTVYQISVTNKLFFLGYKDEFMLRERNLKDRDRVSVNSLLL